jgi:hypothetical protein
MSFLIGNPELDRRRADLFARRATVVEGANNELVQIDTELESLNNGTASVGGAGQQQQGGNGRRRGGRPKGSKNKPQAPAAQAGNGRRRGRPPKQQPASGNQKGRKRPQNQKTLKETVKEIVLRNKGGLDITQITQKVMSSDYKSGGDPKNFSKLIYQALRSLQHDDKVLTYNDEESKYVAKAA